MRRKKGMSYFLRRFLDKDERMNRKIQKHLLFVFSILGGLLFFSINSQAAVKDTEYIRQIEKKMLSPSTSKIQYRYGKIKSTKNSSWKKAATISLSAKKWAVSKKGWYTLRIRTTKKKYKKLQVKLKKKTYLFSCNHVIKQKAGYYYIVPKGLSAKGLTVAKASIEKNANITVENRMDFSSFVWQLESAGGKKFRLKNVNSGLYLGNRENKNLPGMLQKPMNTKDKAMIFQAMEADGKYLYIKNESSKSYLCVEGGNAKCSKRKNNKAWKFQLVTTEKPESGAAADGSTTYPVSVAFGHSFPLKGMVNSRYVIKSLCAGIVNGNGVTVLKKEVSPGTNCYDLKGIDAAMTFGKLPAGSYYYRIVITDSLGAEITVVDRKFVVYIPGGSISRTLVYNSSLLDVIGHQSTGTALEKKACASYALAYCNAIVHGTTPSPHTYWLSSSNVDCVWSKGGYTTNAYCSELQVLQAAYGQIAAGKPCILHVTGNSSQHWVTVVGYQNVSAINALAANNLIAVDPWDGAVITVGSKYKIKNTYRLGYYNS